MRAVSRMLDGGAGVTRWLLEAPEDEEDRVVRRRTFRAEDDGVTPWGVTAGALRSRERGREGRREGALDAIGTKTIRCSRTGASTVQVLHRKGPLTSPEVLSVGPFRYVQ
jgi:hypothetical protein